MRGLLLLAITVSTACASTASPPTSGSDGGISEIRDDAGVIDAGHKPDAGHQSDAGHSDGGADSPYFPRDAIWTQDVTHASFADDSETVIDWLSNAGGWGNGNIFQIDFSIDVLHAGADVTPQTFTPTEDFYPGDCDHVPVPLPPGGNIEGEDGYACTNDGDCHLIVVRDSTRQLYEMWRANVDSGTFYGGCTAVWDLTRVYPLSGRGEQCSSADAAGYPIAPLLFTADEVAGGHIDHAIRFILPNERIRHGEYVHPSTHTTNPASGPKSAPAYGSHLRLRADFPLETLPNEGARVVARALQQYGMFLADGGNIALTAQSDRHTTAKWDDLLHPRDLQALKVTDFDVIDHDAPIAYTGDCVLAE